ncbi:S8 family serine peptidase [Ectobacillus sp. JY-23]|uniref:S8 family serine peptidase n=1 Tax=Ectobacillus sp. JY-23 TaxID=2933872 RepID=UPI001FF66006|nr:S8 family serine peptidase [Ectobacillus sp. JY-23]UOY92573.1 S8 family serine peptidase [Ectobacillus sp. JY-23]
MKKKFMKKATTLALGVGLVSTGLSAPYVNLPTAVHATAPASTEAILAKLTPEQREALAKLSTDVQTGLFLQQDVNLESESNVSIIVAFKQKPEKMAVLEAALRGESLSAAKAKSNVDADHATFKSDLTRIFKEKEDAYKVKRVYKHAFNGVALEVPANKIQDVLKSDAVQAIYSDVTVKAEPPVQTDEASTEAQGQGMADERAFLNVDQLHKEGYTGKGIKVAVLDTGIDYNHPDLKAAYKGGYDFVHNDNDPMETTYEDWIKAGKPGANASSYVTDHGTHVAGTIAGQGANNSPYATKGIAPDAELYAYRVLGPGGSGSSEGIIAAIDKAVAEDMDVMNLSLGASYNDPMYPTSIAINNAVLSGVAAIVAAGNDGNKMYTLGSPGTASLALTVGASDVAMKISTMKGNLDVFKSDMRLLARGFTDDLSTFLNKTFEIVNIAGYGQASNYKNINVKGKVVLVPRGTNNLNDKILQAKINGAAAILIYNNNAAEGHMPFYLAEGSDFIPAFNITNADGLALKQKISEGKIQFSFSEMGEYATVGDTLADFSSRGPSRINYDIKPEVTAPGVSVLSTVPSFINSPSNPSDYTYAYQRMSGTSMATPSVAGITALLLQAKPDLQPEDIKAILMNTADPLSKPYSVFEQGAGRVDPYEAMHAGIEIKVKDKTQTILNGKEKQINEATGALSFGNKAFNGKDTKDSRIITITNKGQEEKTFDVTVKFQKDVREAKDAEKNGVEVKTDASVRVGPNGDVSRNVSLFIPHTAEKGIYEGYIVYTNHDNPEETYQVPFGVHYVEEGFQEVNLDRVSMSTDRNATSNPFYYPFLGGSFILQSHMKTIDVVLTDATTGKDLGIVGSFNGMLLNEGVLQSAGQLFKGVYYPFTGDSEQPISSRAALAKEGHYKMKFIAYNDEGKIFVAAPDLFVDNTMPDAFNVQVEGEKPGNPFVEYKQGQQTLGLTASIHDNIVDSLNANGLGAKQSQNSIWYFYNSALANGKLTLDENGHVKDEIAMNPRIPVLNVAFEGIDQATNSYGAKEYYFVQDNTPYVYGQPNLKTRANRVVTRIGETVTITLTANNVNKVKQAVYDFSTNTSDTNIVSINLRPEAQQLGGKLNVTSTNTSATVVKSKVEVAFDGGAEVSGDIPMVDVTLKIPEMAAPTLLSSFRSVTSTFTSTDSIVTKPFTYIAPIDILPNKSSVIGYIQAEGFRDAQGNFDYIRDYTTVGANVTVRDNVGMQHSGVMDKRGQFYITGIPVTRDIMNVNQDIPGHFTMHNTFTYAFRVMDGELYGVQRRLGTETMQVAPGGDVNKDDVIDIMDALEIQTTWGSASRHTDINYDGTVDVKDFAFVEKNFAMQNPTVQSAPKAVKSYKSKTLADIKNTLGIK